MIDEELEVLRMLMLLLMILDYIISSAEKRNYAHDYLIMLEHAAWFIEL